MSRVAPILPAGAAAVTGPAGADHAPRTTLAQVQAGAATPGRVALGLAVGLSVALHLAAIAALSPHEEIALEGGGPPTLAAIGHAFEDFVQGAQPVTPAAAPAPPPRAQAPAAPAPPAPAAPVAQPAVPALPQFADAVALARPEATATASPTAPPSEAGPVASSAPPPVVAPARPETAVPFDKPEVTVRTADADTPRPRPRPDPQTRAPAPAPPQPAGNAAQDARRGAETGQQAAPAARSGTADRPAATSGSAAVANYPGEVLRQLQRTRRARVSGRGTAVVVFGIADSGALATVSIAASSGNATLDQAALDHIRRAAPFPPPPAGAQRQFRFEFVGR